MRGSAMDFCGRCDMDDRFGLGVDLMIPRPGSRMPRTDPLCDHQALARPLMQARALPGHEGLQSYAQRDAGGAGGEPLHDVTGAPASYGSAARFPVTTRSLLVSCGGRAASARPK